MRPLMFTLLRAVLIISLLEIAAFSQASRPGSSPAIVVVGDPSGHTEVCTSSAIKTAMQSVENQSMHDPNAALLTLFGGLITGLDASSSGATIVDSKDGTDGGKYTSKDAGSFVCRGLFVHGKMRVEELPGADASAETTAAMVNTFAIGTLDDLLSE